MLLHARIITRWESFLQEEILARVRSHRSVPLRWMASSRLTMSDRMYARSNFRRGMLLRARITTGFQHWARRSIGRCNLGL